MNSQRNKSNWKKRGSILFGFILVWYLIELYIKPVSSEEHFVQGFDVSHYQGSVQWTEIDNTLFPFAIAKATGGETYIDPQFHMNWHGMRQNNIIRGAYHFFYAADDPQKQAMQYLSVVKQFMPTDLPPILDLEITDNMSEVALRERSLVWLDFVEKQTRRRPIIYTDLFFAQRYLNDPRFSRFPLWIAAYQAKLVQLPASWLGEGICQKTWCLWQHSQNGRVSGVNAPVDLNHFNGNFPALLKFIKDSHQ